MFRFIFSMQLSVFLLSSVGSMAGGRDSTAGFNPEKIMIIPYEPRMHLSDADLDIAKYSETDPMQVRALFRSGIAEKLNTQLGTSYRTHSLMHDLRPEAMQELKKIYAAIDYTFDTSYAILHPKPDSTVKGKWNENKARKKELEKRSLSGDVKYMNVRIDPALLASLNQKYGADVFVFLTQAEIKTNVKDCGDYQYGQYQRDFKIHYAVYDRNGTQLYGDVATVHFPSGSNEIQEIMAKNFPKLGAQISHSFIRN